MGSWHDILIQAIGFLGVLFFFISYQVKDNRRLFIIQTLGCLTFSLQFALLGAFGGCLSLFINITRNIMLTKYDECKAIRWKGWIAVFAALSIVSALFTWDGWISILPVVGTVSGTIGCWTNNAGKIRAVNLCVNSPGMMLYDVLVGSWGGVLNEGMTMLSIIISIARFGWKSLDSSKMA
ncbi:MAG: YgjV family protein [Lachnospiraceae bacterium]|jgi:hypothetical protein